MTPAQRAFPGSTTAQIACATAVGDASSEREPGGALNISQKNPAVPRAAARVPNHGFRAANQPPHVRDHRAHMSSGTRQNRRAARAPQRHAHRPRSSAVCLM